MMSDHPRYLSQIRCSMPPLAPVRYHRYSELSRTGGPIYLVYEYPILALRSALPKHSRLHVKMVVIRLVNN